MESDDIIKDGSTLENVVARLYGSYNKNDIVCVINGAQIKIYNSFSSIPTNLSLENIKRNDEYNSEYYWRSKRTDILYAFFNYRVHCKLVELEEERIKLSPIIIPKNTSRNKVKVCIK